MPAEQLELIKELSGGKLYSSAILGTYQFDGEFFENEVLPVLNQLDITNIIVLTESQTYREASELTKAGKSYYIDYVRCSGVHHPKFTALLGHDHGRAFIGSANLTEAGWQRSGEMMTVVDYPNETTETISVFTQLREFIELSVNQIHSSRATAAINEAFRDAPWLPEALGQSRDEHLQILHNHNEPLLPQVLDHVDDQSIEEIEICSPFFSGPDEAAFEEVCNVDPEEIKINLQPDRVEGFNAEVLQDSCFEDINVTVNNISLTGDDADRYLHAKLLILKGSAGVWAFYGSPNFTTPALLKTRADGNIELGVLRYEADPNYFDYLLDPDAVSRDSIVPNSVTYRQTDSIDTDEDQPDFYLNDAYLCTDGTLVVEHEESTPSQATIHLRRPGNDTDLEIDIPEPGDNELRYKDEQITQLCRQSVQVKVTLEVSGTSKTSDARWIALPTLEQTPRRSEVQSIETTDGRDGLIEVLDRLPSWGIICEFLKNVNINSMEVGGGGGIIIDGDPPGDDDGGMEDWDPKGRDEIFENKATTLLDKMETSQQNLWLNLSNPEEFESFVNQYIALSKLVLWWKSQDPYEISDIGIMRTATKTIGEFIMRCNSHTEPEAAQALEEDHRLFEHTAIIMCYVDRLQQKAGYEHGSNNNLYHVFRSTNQEVLKAFGEFRGQPVPTKEHLEDCLEEYATIDAVSVDANEIESYCRELTDGT